MKKNLYSLAVILAIALPIGFSNANDSLIYASNSTSLSGNQMGDSSYDTATTTAIVSRIKADDDLKGLDIKVETMNHTVNLSGIVPNDMLKQKVIDIAKNTGGVTSVVATQLEVVKN